MDQILELLVETVEIEHFVVVFLKVVVLGVEEVVQFFRQRLILSLEQNEVGDEIRHFFFETFGLQSVVDQSRRRKRGALLTFN